MTRTALALLLACTACAPAATKATVRTVQLPTSFGGAPGASIGTIDWQAFFADPNLNALVHEALANNYDLQIAMQRIEVARAGVLGQSGAKLPQIALGAGASLTKFGRYTAEGAGNASTDIRPGQRVPDPLPDFAIGLDASWEADLWGRLSHLQGAARARYLATVEGTNLVVTNLVADVATAYFELLALDRVDEILANTVARQTQALDIMRIEKQAGRTNELAVDQFEAQLASSKALAAANLVRIREVEAELNLLLGRTPQPIHRSKDLLDRDVPATYATGVPSDLLRNRADIREAELEVQASRFDVSAARGAFYPRLQISASLGYEAFNPRFLLSTPASLAYRIGAGLVAPLVNRRGIQAAFATAQAQQLEAMYRYQSVVLRAFTEVTTGLYAVQQAGEIVAQNTAKVAVVTGTVDAADALFRAGKATYLDVLLAQQATLEAQLQLVAALRDRRIASVRLYKALGGGWQRALTASR